MPLKAGPLTRDDLKEVWRGALDKSYREPFLHAGDGRGLEVHGQMWEVFARASEAVDVTTQAAFICPWSGQTNPPAGGGKKATVTLTVTRTKLLDKPLVLTAGQILVGEETTDWSEEGSELFATGRRYVLLEALVFHPGEQGPFDVAAEAEKVGYGYNNPLPRTISLVSQPGAAFNNNLATTTYTGPSATGGKAQALLRTKNEPDMFVPGQEGQYVIYTGGANLSRIGRIVAYSEPAPTPSGFVGSAVTFDVIHSVVMAIGSAQNFVAGDVAAFDNTPNQLLVDILGARDVAGKRYVTFAVRTGDVAAVASSIASRTMASQSGATALPGATNLYIYRQEFTSESPVAGVGGSEWRILDWVRDWGLDVRNTLRPTGGVAPWLDELAFERKLSRLVNEDDETFRQRVKSVADVVTPNAIRRTLSRTLGGIPWCFREVGSAVLPGFFYDGDKSGPGGDQGSNLAVADKLDAYDVDVLYITGGNTGVFLGARDIDLQPFAIDRHKPMDSERVVLEKTATLEIAATGYMGLMVEQTDDHPGFTMTLIRKTGRLPASLTGWRVRGLESGAILHTLVSAFGDTAQIRRRRFRYYLDYTQFRAFFLVGLPRLGFGEFGFAYDAGAYSAYDLGATNYFDFYDGFPAKNKEVYQRVYQALDQVKAGGVTFELYLEEIGCP